MALDPSNSSNFEIGTACVEAAILGMSQWRGAIINSTCSGRDIPSRQQAEGRVRSRSRRPSSGWHWETVCRRRRTPTRRRTSETETVAECTLCDPLRRHCVDISAHHHSRLFHARRLHGDNHPHPYELPYFIHVSTRPRPVSLPSHQYQQNFHSILIRSRKNCVHPTPSLLAQQSLYRIRTQL